MLETVLSKCKTRLATLETVMLSTFKQTTNQCIVPTYLEFKLAAVISVNCTPGMGNFLTF